MYAVIKSGGKQVKVAKNDVIVVEKLAGEAGETLALDSVLMLGEGGEVTTGSPFVAGACVAAEVVEQTRGDKIVVFKKKRRQGYRRRNGHRQDLTVLKVTDILTDGKKPAKTKAKAKPEPKAEPAPDAPAPDTPAKEAAAEKPAAKKAAPKQDAAKKKAAKKKAPAKKADAKKKAPAKKADAKKKAAPKKKSAGSDKKE